MSLHVAPVEEATPRSPFLTAGAVASSMSRPTAAILHQLRSGVIPGYKYGTYWFVPRHELDGLLRRDGRAPLSHDDVITHLLRGYPATLGLGDLEDFFDVQRPYLYRVLSSPLLAPHRRGAEVRRADLAHALAQARNDYEPAP